MAIDTVIAYDCVPKQTLGTQDILERLKGLERARAVIRLFREEGDSRPPSDMGFEFTRTNADGEEETRVIVVQDMLDQAAALDPLAHHCVGCPANIRGEPYGCMNFVQYPLSAAGERWLLDQLPSIDNPLVWLLLREGVQQLGYDGARVRPLRGEARYFEESRVMGRDMVEFLITADQVFEMLFLLGDVQPPHAGVLLLLFGAIPRDVEADAIVQIMNHTINTEGYPFLFTDQPEDDITISDLKIFFRALHGAWTLNVPLTLDV